MKPLVAIHCLVYNHEPYLRDCLEGFVMQKTNFPFVAIVHDDASTDKSADIIREYAEKYPDIIKPIYETENQYSKRDGSHRRIMNEAIRNTGCKYVAMCEGDDYWVSPNKLQKQVNYMESHPDCSICAHNSLTLNSKTREIGLFNKRLINTKDYSLETFLTKGWFTPTQSLLYRLCDYQSFDDIPGFVHGDYSLLINLLLKQGTYLHYDNDIMSVYRNDGWASIHFKETDLYDDFVELLTYYKEKSYHHCDEIFEQQIERQKKGKKLYINYIQDVKKSHSLFVRLGHGLCRCIVAVVNKYVKCLNISKRVEINQVQYSEQLD